jgi:enamine deaminase RidA (YjgF/YER057c/UK114 family)
MRPVKPRRVNVEGVGRLPAFCHAVLAGDHIYVSGMIGAAEGELRLVPGGIRAETTQTLTRRGFTGRILGPAALMNRRA